MASVPKQDPPLEASGSKNEPRKFRPIFSRGVRTSTPLGTAVFTAFRVADIPLQSYILTRAFPPPETFFTNAFDNPVTASRAALLVMSGMSVFKQLTWCLGIHNEPMPVGTAVIFTVWNNLNNAIATGLFSSYPPSDGPTTTLRLGIGVIFFIVGLGTELISEIQRKRFKDAPENRGKLYMRGLWSWSRHANYSGYIFWRAGIALVGGGWVYSGVSVAFYVWNFLYLRIPELEDYMSCRYGEQWTKYEKKCRWKLLLGLV
jgi:protein-S-isoprenylcysteine O-methyltransferase Ste14